MKRVVVGQFGETPQPCQGLGLDKAANWNSILGSPDT
jgi:hypothetical protein